MRPPTNNWRLRRTEHVFFGKDNKCKNIYDDIGTLPLFTISCVTWCPSTLPVYIFTIIERNNSYLVLEITCGSFCKYIYIYISQFR